MELQKLSTNVNKKADSSVRRVIAGLCVLAGVIVLALIVFYTIRSSRERVQLYSSEIDSTMSEKMAFVNTVAVGAASVQNKDYRAYVDTMAEQYEDVSAVYVCVQQEGVVYKDGIMTYMSGGWVPEDDFVVSDRPWYSDAIASDDVCVSEPYVDEQTGNICITLSKAISQNGSVVGVAGLDMYMDDLVTLIEGSYDGGNYVFLTTGQGTILTHPDEEIALSNETSATVAEALGGKYAGVCGSELTTKMIWDYSGGPKFAINNKAETTGWNVVAVMSLGSVLAVILITIALAVIFGILLSSLVRRQMTGGINPMFEPLEELAANVGRISNGELDYNFRIDEQSKEINALSLALNNTMKGLKHYISEITSTVTAISEKNLAFEVDGDYTGDYEKIKDALVDIERVLNESFTEINEQAAAVLQFSENLSATSEDVAQAATMQSEAVVNASNEMKKLTDNMEKISEYASSIKENTDSVSTHLTTGSDEMNELVTAMDEIASCYEEIAGFVTEINGIASQTNLLALNASIEAARAGESGRGFAVVADEISALSASSSQSSAKISTAINNSLASVERGKELVARTDKTISDSAECSAGNTQMVDEIVAFVETQKNSADEISASIGKISEMVGNNAASAEENSAISSNLGECAKSLMDMIAQFRLRQ